MGNEHGDVECLRLSANALVSMRAWKLSSKPELYEALLLLRPNNCEHFQRSLSTGDIGGS